MAQARPGCSEIVRSTSCIPPTPSVAPRHPCIPGSCVHELDSSDLLDDCAQHDTRGEHPAGDASRGVLPKQTAANRIAAPLLFGPVPR
jgi:hypothetical protein